MFILKNLIEKLIQILQKIKIFPNKPKHWLFVWRLVQRCTFCCEGVCWTMIIFQPNTCAPPRCCINDVLVWILFIKTNTLKIHSYVERSCYDICRIEHEWEMFQNTLVEQINYLNTRHITAIVRMITRHAMSQQAFKKFG